MLKLISPCSFMFGEVDEASLPKLPSGFTYRTGPGQWVMAVGHGMEFFFSKDRLYRCRIATKRDVRRTSGLLKVGMVFCDTRSFIRLSA